MLTRLVLFLILCTVLSQKQYAILETFARNGCDKKTTTISVELDRCVTQDSFLHYKTTCDAQSVKLMLCPTSDCDLLCQEITSRRLGCFDEASVPVSLRCGLEPTPKPDELYLQGFWDKDCKGDYVSSVIGSSDCIRGPGISLKVACQGSTYRVEQYNNLECSGTSARRWIEREGCVNLPLIGSSVMLPKCKSVANQTQIFIK
jgi:hypothetical protein